MLKIIYEYVYMCVCVYVSISMSISISGEGNGNPLQYSCLEITMDRETCQATAQSE